MKVRKKEKKKRRNEERKKERKKQSNEETRKKERKKETKKATNKQRKKETKKQRNKETKHQRKKERKKERKTEKKKERNEKKNRNKDERVITLRTTLQQFNAIGTDSTEKEVDDLRIDTTSITATVCFFQKHFLTPTTIANLCIFFCAFVICIYVRVGRQPITRISRVGSYP
jgi:hypothetical protein